MSSVAVGKFVSTLLASREQAHVYHLLTRSYSTHKALQAYYEGIVDLVDKYAETYMGKTGRRIQFPSSIINRRLNTRPVNAKAYFMALFKRIHAMRLPKNSYLQNIRDEIEELIRETLYMLSLRNGNNRN